MLIKEIELVSSYFPENRPVKYLHLGGGTPTFLSDAALTELMYHVSRNFHLLEEERGDYSLEIDPREVDEKKIALLRGLGFNRVSLGIQDFDTKVQAAINRQHSFAKIKALMLQLTDYNFGSINFDLIYGLPFQTEQSFKETIEQVISLNPDRLSIFNYAHLPLRFKSQSLMREETMPSPEKKLAIFVNAANRLSEAGYQYIGMDHFAKPYDSLAKAQNEGNLHRNFQGYSVDADADLLGLGVSAISQIDNVYCQNNDSIKAYEASIEKDKLAIYRGASLSQDDEIRRWVISQLMCHKNINLLDFAANFACQFEQYFSKELPSIRLLAEQDLLTLDASQLQLTELGDRLVRRVCLVFDQYNNEEKLKKRFSRII
jgi:oxygen-independent coproporphyrinogen-3 oxidase